MKSRSCLRSRVVGGLLPLLALLVLQLASSGCLAFSYLPQATAGQRDLARRARDIDELVADGRVDSRMRRLLSQVRTIKAFGEAHGLKPTANYRKYVRVEGNALVWVVSASDPLAFRSRTWSFPLVGSFTYLGWFKRKDADAFASDLAKDGLDVDVRASGAYSTAGYFEDSVVSTMIPPGKLGLGELADTVLHEMTHATIFVRYQSTLNESVAMFVGSGLAHDYLDETLGAAADETQAYEKYERWADARGARMKEAYDELVRLYGSKEPAAAKLAAKKDLLSRLHDELQFKRPINNATLIQYRTYHSGQAELAELLALCGHSWPRFVAAVKRLENAHLPRPQESDVGKLVQPLLQRRCEG